MSIKVIILDFDGVIVESNNIKHEAFSELFREFPDHYDQMMAYHFAHNHVNRHAKFKYIMENILKQRYDDEFAQRWAENFSELTRSKIIDCPYVSGALEFIKYFFGKHPLYLASATPLDELEIILQRRGLLKYFKKVYGAPTPKKEMFDDILNNERVNAGSILFVGDSPEDRNVADIVGCKFVARASGYNFDGVESFRNMLEIKDWLLSKEAI